MTESTLPPPAVGEEDKASPHRRDAQETLRHPEPVEATETAPAAATENGIPPALGAVTVAELLAARELTAATLAVTELPEGDKEDKVRADDSESATAQAAEAPAAEPAPLATVIDPPPSETDGGPSPELANVAAPSGADEDSSRPPTDAADAPESLSADAEPASSEVTSPVADAQSVTADPPASDTDTEPNASAARPAPDPIVMDRGLSLSEALQEAARLAAEAQPAATAASERAEPRSDAPAEASEAAALASAPPRVAGGAQPLTSAFDAAAKLAADANAAAEALESLKRLLQRQQQSAGMGFVPSPAPPADDAAWAAAPPKRAVPPPLPSSTLAASDHRGTDGIPDEEPQLPLQLTRKRTPERVRFDLRGFLAGFALSWAFGVVLYLFMTAG